MSTRLMWHSYRYYPYEKELACREVAALFCHASHQEVEHGLEVDKVVSADCAQRLTYFAGFANGHASTEAIQSRLENVPGSRKNRQATRYSVHGLHEYKGKFNPQVVKAILNIFSVRTGDRVLDPFCGSGTTLVECSHIGAFGYGIDRNPLAVFIGNAKLHALVTSACKLRNIFASLSSSVKRTRSWNFRLSSNARDNYLCSWFDPSILQTVEIIRTKILDAAGPHAPIFLTIASNLLRDYSKQDPNDLRIRRRTSSLPDTPFQLAFLTACQQALDRLQATQQLLGTQLPHGQAHVKDVGTLGRIEFSALFDAAITSPPYAMALPYIDTQRLSLVWLNLISPNNILQLESELIGSREIRGPTARRELLPALLGNEAELPDAEAEFCLKLQSTLGQSDGFRRKAVPMLLYRYLADMRNSFKAIISVMKPNARFALIVGHNHTILGGVRQDIDTPKHLASVAQSVGWHVDELVPLQTYHRYGYHMTNAVGAETLVLLRRNKE